MFLWVTPLSFFIFFTNRPYRGLKPRVRFFGWTFDWPASVLLYTPATSNLSRTQLAVIRRNLFNHKADALHWALGPFNRSAYDEEQRPRTHTNNDAKINTKTTANSPASYATRASVDIRIKEAKGLLRACFKNKTSTTRGRSVIGPIEIKSQSRGSASLIINGVSECN